MEYAKVVKRDHLLNQLIDGRHNNLIKIVTGIRRSGKTFLLFNLFSKYLHDEGIDDNHIIKIALDDRKNVKLCNPDSILEYFDSKFIDDKMYYVLIDEIQMLDDFVGVLNSLLHRHNVDTYVTGSNSKFLSKDVATEFRGRGDEIHIYPLSFAEYFNAVGGDMYECWSEYCTYGGLPQLLILKGDKKKEEFLLGIQKTVYLKDLVERCIIKNQDEFQELLNVIASCIGSPCNPNKLANTFKSVKNITIDSKTISKYLSYMEDAFLIEKSMRYDIKGKKYIGTLSKYYFQDIGLRNAATGFRQIEESHIMENIIYNELRSRGFRVDVGLVEAWQQDNDKRQRRQLEVDFVAEQGSLRYYIQSVLMMPDNEKKEKEIASLKKINDAFKRIIIVKSNMKPYYDDNGFLIMGLFEFLLKPEIMDNL